MRLPYISNMLSYFGLGSRKNSHDQFANSQRHYLPSGSEESGIQDIDVEIGSEGTLAPDAFYKHDLASRISTVGGNIKPIGAIDTPITDDSLASLLKPPEGGNIYKSK